ncbi:uncharacterized protein LOC123271706 [Cotesia glomerata]|uniref:uncharacterized protein LOC123271706 n=1 Tax=Cotesia glomerata TaxID=32391 RepID=UPI001D005D5E|nr:uncharacterized protein LOC123271706 [Cotesia glomerata]
METLTISILIITILVAPCQSFWWYYDYSDSDYSSWWPSYDYEQPEPRHIYTETHEKKKSGSLNYNTDVVTRTNKDSIPLYKPPRIAIKIDPYNLFNSHIDVKVPIEKKIERKEELVNRHAINYDSRVDVHDKRHATTSETKNNDFHFRII